MGLFSPHQKINIVNVPFAHRLFYCVYTVLIVFSFSSKFILSQHYHPRLESSQNYDYFFDATPQTERPELGEPSIGTQVDHYAEPTPPIDNAHLLANHLFSSTSNFNRKIGQHITVQEAEQANLMLNNNNEDYIQPDKVIKHNYLINTQSNLFSPIFNFQLFQDSNLVQNDYAQVKDLQTDNPQQQGSSDLIPGLDFSESGSGAVWDNHNVFDDTSNVMEDSTSIGEYDSSPSNLLPTPVLTPTFDQATTFLDDKSNRPPIINHRLPKLSVTAGMAWRYFIPYDTFLDEDGDLRQLKSMVYWTKSKILANTSSSDSNMIYSVESDSKEPVSQYFSWLQYDQASLLLYGFPVENDLGKHELILEVSDRWGALAYEIVEINVKQHQSSRAFTHFFRLKGISWNLQRYSSIVEALIDLTKRISSVYHDQSSKKMLVQRYDYNSSLSTNDLNAQEGNNINLNQFNRDSTIVFFSITWSNTTIPIHPCNLDLIENLTRPLIDVQALKSDWMLEKSENLEMTTSLNLNRALSSSFKVSSFDFGLQGSCEGKYFFQAVTDTPESYELLAVPKVRTKIGKLTWRLGEPIEYRIPSEVFGNDKGTYMTEDLQLTLHTIDGQTLDQDPKYSYLEFDQDNQTIYGLSYDYTNHIGQRELQLTAKHPNSTLKTREVFIINIEAQDLTAVNNRAFSMSLYILPRTVAFGPRERVLLSYKITEAFRPNYFRPRNLQESDFVVVDIQKFTTYYHSNMSINVQSEISRVPDIDNNFYDEFNNFRDSSSQRQFFYKFTWTNKTIGLKGDCPVEVIRENVLYALEQSMLELKIPEANLIEDLYKNDSVRFYERLRLYFDPEIELVHLRFEPLGACLSTLELHDVEIVGNSDIANQADKVGSIPLDMYPEVSTPYTYSTTPKIGTEPDPDEYWSIIVLIILVMALIFVIIMFFLGMHTYKINQDKRFELQIRLAQARQNSMFLSSMILANQANPNDIYGQILHQEAARPMSVVQDEEKCSRKPVILETEKRLLANGQRPDLTSTAVQLNGQMVHTMPMKPNVTLALDSNASSWQHCISSIVPNQNPSRVTPIIPDDKQRSMTLDRRSSGSFHNFPSQYATINHSQSILTVASLAGPIIPQRVPVVYAHYPVINEFRQQQSTQDYPSLKRKFSQQRLSAVPLSSYPLNPAHQPLIATNNLFADSVPRLYAQNLRSDTGAIGSSSYNKIRSPSYSSSASATTQSVISNPNYAPNN